MTKILFPWRKKNDRFDEPLPPEALLRRLLRVIQWVAADFDDQVAVYIKGRRKRKKAALEVPDEVGITYLGDYDFVPQLVEAGLITKTQQAKLQQLRELFIKMYDDYPDEIMWTLEAMRTKPEWSTTRELARQILSLFGKEREWPELWKPRRKK